MNTVDIVVYKHTNGKWIKKHNVTELELDEMFESPFVQEIRTFTYEEWKKLKQYAEEHNESLAKILDEHRTSEILGKPKSRWVII